MVAIMLTDLLIILVPKVTSESVGEESNIKLSLSYLNRSYNQATKDLHRKNRIGIKASAAKRETRKNLSGAPRSHLSIKKGRSVILFDVKTEKEFVFDTTHTLHYTLCSVV